MIPIGVACVVLVSLILLNRPVAERASEVTARQNLRHAMDAARQIEREHGTFLAATKLELKAIASDLLFIDPDEASNAPEVVSVYASDTAWAAANRADTGTCYYVRMGSDAPTTFGTGADCTGVAALGAAATAWPGL